MKLLKNRDESDETQSEYYDHEAIRLRGQKLHGSEYLFFPHCDTLSCGHIMYLQNK